MLIVPPALEDTADQIAKSEYVINTAGATAAAGAAAMSNTQKGKYEVLVMPELAGADTTWYMAATKQKAPPLVVVENQGIMSEFLGQGSEHTFRTRKFLYGVSWRGNAGYGMWFSMYKAIA
jgi:phage major head subunit gpT-like protein